MVTELQSKEPEEDKLKVRGRNGHLSVSPVVIRCPFFWYTIHFQSNIRTLASHTRFYDTGSVAEAGGAFKLNDGNARSCPKAPRARGAGRHPPKKEGQAERTKAESKKQKGQGSRNAIDCNIFWQEMNAFWRYI